jgi:hypothetical protein
MNKGRKALRLYKKPLFWAAFFVVSQPIICNFAAKSNSFHHEESLHLFTAPADGL